MCKIVTIVPPYFILVLISLFANAHEGKKNSQKNKSYIRTHKGMRLTHDGATFHTARKTINLVQAKRVYVLTITDLNRIDHICPTSGTLSAV